MDEIQNDGNKIISDKIISEGVFNFFAHPFILSVA